MSHEGRIRSRFTSDQASSNDVLERARECAFYADPAVLPPEGLEANSKLPESYQSDVSFAVFVLGGRMAGTMFPPGQPWFQLALDPVITYDQTVPDEAKMAANQQLMLTELMAQAILESTQVKGVSRSRPLGFLSQKLKAIRQLIVTGDVLERLGDDYRMRVYRRDQYTTKRDSAGDVLYHTVREWIDPLALPPEQLEAAGFDAQFLENTPDKRKSKLYTLVEWHPQTGRWVIEQEINDNIIVTSEEVVSPYFATPWRLAGEEDYGRGHVELNLGSIRSLDTLHKRNLDILGMMSKYVPVLDIASQAREQDLAQPSGTPMRARVRGGKVDDIAFLAPGNISEHQSLIQGIDRATQAIHRAFLVESGGRRDAERVTTVEIARDAAEIDGALGGVYVPISEQQHIPLVRRLLWQLRRDNIAANILPDNTFDIRSLTGLGAIVRQEKARALLEIGQVAAQMGPEAVGRINFAAMLATYARYRNFYEPGLTKTDEQMEAERQAAAQDAARMAAAQQIPQTAGNLIEQQQAAALEAQGAQ